MSLDYKRQGETFGIPHGILVLVRSPSYSGWEGQQKWAQEFAQALLKETFPAVQVSQAREIAHQLLAEGVFGVLQSQPYMQQVDGHRLSLQMAKKCNIRAPGWLQERVGSNMPAVVIRADRRDWPEENAIIAAAKGYGRFFDAAPEDTPLSQKLSARVQKLMRSNPQALSAVQLALFR
ncbi:hypothetical protein WJX84_004187 [Apatococcus fuscideae]|uniref:Uncharacterized protein n=1 Tax=Apatococcus fuscideae TaxID=2026836 RepID=A0AAW1S7A9_9CHLO